MKSSLLCAIALLSAVSSLPAQAQQHWQSGPSAESKPRWYGSLGVGVSYIPSMTVEATNGTGTVTSGKQKHDMGLAGNVGLGVRLGNDSELSGLRFELEYGYANNGIDKILDASASGDITKESIMVNVLYDFMDDDEPWVPYAGGGIGMMKYSFEEALYALDDSDNLFAFQVIMGIGYQPIAMPSTIWHMGYRYLGSQDAELTTSTGASFTAETETHMLETGVRYLF